MSQPPTKRSGRTLTLWAAVAAIGGPAVWVGLSFTVSLPIDDAKVYPDLTEPQILASSWTAIQVDDRGVVLFDLRTAGDPDGATGYDFPLLGHGSSTMAVRTANAETVTEKEIALEDYPHTRRCVAQMIEKGSIRQLGAGPIDLSQVTRDPFLRTRVAARKLVQRVRSTLGLESPP